MSTFRGVMEEFPDIRVDFFRRDPELRAPLACFLSHVHSDHLAGLETLKAPFIYCSPATREILLRLERYPHRLNFELGILESRKQTYSHLQRLLKPIPLETPTRIELEPGNFITITLFDANHCPGSVMFLFESDKKAVLYTGDIRSESWFVDNLTRNPFLIEYTAGLKKLDCIYLDTSYTENISFPTQADGLKELLQKVSRYPPDTTFHFTAWTYGYEKVWMGLSRTLKSQIHVDMYKLRMYQALRGNPAEKNPLSGPFITHEGPVLAGYQCGNTQQDGCLTNNPDVRIHSCEKGMHCSKVDDKTVWIKPIITRTQDGVEIAEVGVGGGGADLIQRPELELDSDDALEQLLSLFEDEDDSIMEDVRYKLLAVLRSTKMTISLDDLGLLGLDRDQNEMSITHFAELVSRSAVKKRNTTLTEGRENKAKGLPKVITFPYSRHSSVPELCALVSAFKPKDVYPCTVDEGEWHEGVSIRAKFGRYCSGTKFRHDFEMRDKIAKRFEREASEQTHTTESSEEPENRLSFVSEVENPKFSVLKRDAQGRLRPFDVEGNQVAVSSETDRKATPPREIVAVSPGSSSQSLRRKHIVGDLEANKAKRTRLQLDGSDSPLPAYSGGRSQLSHSHPRDSSLSIVTKHSGPSPHSDTPGSEASSNADCSREPGQDRAPLATLQDDNEYGIAHGDDILDEYLDYMTSNTFFDAEDQVQRCGLCGHELWSELMGSCTHCEEGQFGYPYFEVVDPAAGPRLEIAVNEYADTFTNAEDRREIVGDHLDDHSSAYDSQDADAKFNEEYEVDSFIDDSSQTEEGEEGKEDASVSDGETDYKQKFQELQARHAVVLNDYEELAEAHHDLLKDIGVEFSDSDEMDEMNEDGILVVEAAAPDLVVTELVLSQAQEQSQNSEISEDRVRDRAEAFAAVSNENSRGWHSISLVSTSDNHTKEEVEL